MPILETMKHTVTLFSVLLLATSPAAIAQEDDASPNPDLQLRATDPQTRSEPSVSVPSESSSSNYPRPGTPLATPRPTASPAAAATSSPARTKASPRPSPSPSPARTAASPAATPAGPISNATRGNVSATIRDLESRWAASIAAHDITVPQQLVAADYIGVNSAGRVVSKAALLSDMKRDKNSYDSAVNSGVTVRVHGNTAVAVGTTKQTGKNPAGQAFNYTYRWTDTWLERNGQWQCVASQSFLVTR